MILLIGAVIPSIILLVYICKKDKIEKEPPKLLLKLFIFGALTVISAFILENIGIAIISLFLPQDSIIYAFLEFFIVVALSEEGGKYFVLKKLTWNNPAFNYTFDAVVYSVFASLGFATLENILYVLSTGYAAIVARGLLAVPAHCIDAIFMGYFFGLAKRASANGREDLSSSYRKKALIIPAIMHGFYDFSLTESGYPIFTVLFFAFVIISTVLAVRKVRILSSGDSPLF